MSALLVLRNCGLRARWREHFGRVAIDAVVRLLLLSPGRVGVDVLWSAQQLVQSRNAFSDHWTRLLLQLELRKGIASPERDLNLLACSHWLHFPKTDGAAVSLGPSDNICTIKLCDTWRITLILYCTVHCPVNTLPVLVYCVLVQLILYVHCSSRDF